jgi:hypothetical protein
MATYAEQIGKLRDRRKNRPANQAVGAGDTGRPPKKGSGRAPAKRPPTKKRPPAPVDPYGGRGDDPSAVTAPLTPRTLDTEAAAAARTKYQPQEDEFGAQQRVSAQQQTNIGNWFQQYQDAVAKAQGESAAYDKGVQDAITARAAQAGTADPGATPEAQQAAAARKTSEDSFGAMLAAQGSAHNTYFADKGRIGAGEAAQQHINEAGRSATLAEGLRKLLGEKGDFVTQYKSTARDAERKNELERAAFNLDTQTEQDKTATQAAQIKQDAKDKAAARSVSRKNTRDRLAASQQAADKKAAADANKINQYGYSNAEWARHSPEWRQRQIAKSGKGGKSGPSQDHLDKVRKASGDALTRIDKAKGRYDALTNTPYRTGAKDANGHDVLNPDGTPQTRKPTKAEVQAQLSKEGYSPNEIHLALTKYWGPAEIAMAHQLGIRVPRDRIKAQPGGANDNPVQRQGRGDMK